MSLMKLITCVENQGWHSRQFLRSLFDYLYVGPLQQEMMEFVRSFVDLVYEVSLCSYIFWVHGMVFPVHVSISLVVLVQELLADSVISFSGVVVQLFGCSLILQELSAFFDVFEGSPLCRSLVAD